MKEEADKKEITRAVKKASPNAGAAAALPAEASGEGSARQLDSVKSSAHFSFGARRFGSGQHRRLFVPQESSSDPAFLHTLERPQALMRVISPSL